MILNANMQGLAALGAEEGGASTSKWIWWPNDIKALAEQTDTEIWSLSRDFDAFGGGAYDSESGEWNSLQSFNAFVSEWDAYYKGLGYLNYLSGGTVGTLQSYRLRANDWRNKLISFGGTPSTPAPPNLPTDKPSAFQTSMRWAAGAAIAVAVVYGVSKIVPLVQPLVPTRANPRRRRRGRKRR